LALQTFPGCRQSVGLGRYYQALQDGTKTYPVQIADIGYEPYTGTTVGIQSPEFLDFDTLPIGAYIMGGGDEYYYEDYNRDNDVITFQFDADVIPDIVIVYPKSSPDDVLKHKAFDGKTKEAIRFFVPESMSIDINTLVRQNRIQAEVVGRSIDRTAVSVRNVYFTVLPVKIGIGTWFDSFSNATQDMAVIREICFITEPNKSYILTIPTACMNVNKGTPGRHDNFGINKLNNHEHKELIQLLKMLKHNNISPTVTQYAVWIITDDQDEDIFDQLLDQAQGGTLLNGVLQFFGVSPYPELSEDKEILKDDIDKAKRIIRQVKKPKGGISFLP
jgi:hypothetical protein